MILVDDLGYSDLGAYGGDAATPTIDRLAVDGVQFSNFHAYPVCAPTRAALMTGQDPHRVGLGSMEGLTPPGVSTTTPGYRGSLEGTYTGLADVMSDAGYMTYQVGKWHLGAEPDQSPRALGFDQNFSLHAGGASHYPDATGLNSSGGRDTVRYERNGEQVEVLAEDFYSTHTYTDEMLRMINEGAESDQPFFGYLAYTAVHDPLHVPDQRLIDKYLDLYLDKNNYNELRSARIDGMADRGLIARDVAVRWPQQTPEWNTLTAEQRRDLAYRMAIYSAMIEDVDNQIARVVDHLEKTGQYDNTMIVVASDNGAASASRQIYAMTPGAAQWQDEHYPLVGKVEEYGRPGSFASLGLPNAQVSSGPYFHSKMTVFEGGTRVPVIIKPPGADNDNDAPHVIDTFGHIADLYPTFAEYAGAEPPNREALSGNSMKPLLGGASDLIGSDEHGMELFGSRAYWEGDWKLVYSPAAAGGTGAYSLYNLATDPGETVDVVATNPAVAQRLSDKWDRYAADNGVVPVTFTAVNTSPLANAAAPYSVDWAE
ncbi:sulfatase-like hydrolase/transferase [Nocardia fluminea]|uniref:sulfatase-like hydrolase/transferase n=1 Tax=Nocardia fluminea TaxID=134984 RepID=UPI00365581C8